MKRKHRHELKQNDFLVWLEQVMEWFEQNKKNLMTAGIIVLTGAVLVGGIYTYRNSQTSTAQILLNEALELFHTPVQDASARENSAVQPAPDQDFKSDEERFRESLTAFEKVIEEYSGLDQGRQARYYAALCHKGIGELDEATKRLEEVTSGSNRDLLYYLASQVSAVVKAERGDLEGAAEIYRLMVDDPNTPLPKDQLLYNLARLKEQAGELEEARLNYQRVLDEFPDSALRTEVMQRNDLIEYRLQS